MRVSSSLTKPVDTAGEMEPIGPQISPSEPPKPMITQELQLYDCTHSIICPHPYIVASGPSEEACPSMVAGKGRECLVCELPQRLKNIYKCYKGFKAESLSGLGSFVLYKCKSECKDRCYDNVTDCHNKCEVEVGIDFGALKPDDDQKIEGFKACKKNCLEDNFEPCVADCMLIPPGEDACHESFSYSKIWGDPDYNCMYKYTHDVDEFAEKCGYGDIANIGGKLIFY
jgi:hypothetical protein